MPSSNESPGWTKYSSDAADRFTSGILIVSGVIGLYVFVADLIGTLPSLPTDPTILTLLILSSLSIAIGIERFHRFQELSAGLTRIENILAKLPNALNRAVDGVEIEPLNTTTELFMHVAERLKNAKSSIDDMTMGTSGGSQNAQERKEYGRYLKAMHQACEKKNLVYREIMTFPPSSYFTRAKDFIARQYSGYRLRFYLEQDPNPPPVLNFMIIDNEEVVVGYYRANILPDGGEVRFAMRHPLIVSMFKDYFETLFHGAEALYESGSVSESALEKISGFLDLQRGKREEGDE